MPESLADTALVRIEELSPFPYSEVKAVLRKYGDSEIVWAQEEPENQGAWSYVLPRLDVALQGIGKEGKKIRYAGRKSGATVATGVAAWHKAEVGEILRDVHEW